MIDIHRHIVLILGTNCWASKIAIDFKKAGFSVVMVGMTEEHVLRRRLSFYNCLSLGHCSIEGMMARLIQPDDLDVFLNGDAEVVKEKIILLNDGAEFPVFTKLDYSMVQNKINSYIIVNTIENFSPFIDLSNQRLVISMASNARPGLNCHLYIERFDRNHLGEMIHAPRPDPVMETDANCMDKNSVYIQSQFHGILICVKEIGETVAEGEEIARVGSEVIQSSVNGKIIGLRHSGELIASSDVIAELDMDSNSNKDHRFGLNIKYISMVLLNYAYRELFR